MIFYLFLLFNLLFVHSAVTSDGIPTNLTSASNPSNIKNTNLTPQKPITVNTTSTATNNKTTPVKLPGKWSSYKVQNKLQQAPLSLVKTNAYYASVALCPKNSLKAWNCKTCKKVNNTQLVDTFSHFLLGTFSYLALNHKDKKIILSFRGSENPMNWMSNILVTQGDLNFVPKEERKDIRAHNGFLGAMDSMSNSFTKGVKKVMDDPKYKAYQLNIVGHSLGGAMASLAAIKIKYTLNLNWEQISLFTYGQPRTGNYQFAEWLDSKPMVVSRAVYSLDPIPRILSDGLFNYAHHNNELFIDNNNIPKYCNSNIMEDPKCALSIDKKLFKNDAHLTYFDAHFTKNLTC